jgi:transcriptional regulator with XRE-family HTH domain
MSTGEIFLSKNLRYLRERAEGKLSQQKLAEEISATRNNIASYEEGRAEPKLSMLQAIAEYFNVTIDQLLSLDLSKLDDEEIRKHQDAEKYASAENLRVLTLTLNERNEENVEIVPEKAAAGYTKGFADPEFIQDLPRISLPFLSKGRTYRAFEISGESMLPLQPGSVVIGEYITDFHSVKNGQACIIVTSDGVVFKKVFNRIPERQTLLLKSSNIAYEPYEVNITEIREIWGFVAYIAKQLPEEQTNLVDLREAFERLEENVLEIRGRAR